MRLHGAFRRFARTALPLSIVSSIGCTTLERSSNPPGTGSDAGASPTAEDVDAGAGAADAGVAPDAKFVEVVAFGGTTLMDESASVTLFTTANQMIVRGDARSGDSVVVRFTGAPRTYLCEEGFGSVALEISGDLFDAQKAFDGTSCAVTVTKIGAVGELVEGSFTAYATNIDPPGATGADFTTVTGRFSLTRSPDL